MQKEGQTPVHIATWEGDESTLKCLYSAGANFSTQDKVAFPACYDIHRLKKNLAR